MTALSVLDLVMIGEGQDLADAIDASRQLARHVEQHGYARYWIAEHHDMPGIGSAATALIIGELAAATTSIRVGAGGIMLPNHSPLVVAEQFGTLDALHPGRIDLGLGRAPGGAGPTVQALRRGAPERDFAQDVVEVMDYLADNGRQPVRGAPGRHDVPLWILGSSLYGADLAAALGLPYAFASHFAPAALDEAIEIYRRDFRPSAQLRQPYVMAGYNVFAADSAEQAQLIATSMQQSFVRLRTGQPGKLQPPVPGYYEDLPAQAQAMLADVLSVSSIGTQADVERDLAAFLRRTQVDEVIITGQIYDVAARKHSFAIAMAAAQALGARELA